MVIFGHGKLCVNPVLMNNSSAEVNMQLNMKLNTNSHYIILYMSTHILWSILADVMHQHTWQSPVCPTSMSE